MSSPPSRPMEGRVSVVTGATSGIGLELARRLAEMGSTTVIVGRGSARVQDIAREVARLTGNVSVTGVGVSDLALRSETARLGEALLSAYPKIHVLVNNAGAYFRRREVTPEGHERTFALNVLSPFLLTSILVPRLVESAPARVVNVSSMAHRGRTVDLARLETPEGYRSGYGAYGTSKLELLLLTREFARRLAGTGVTVNAVHPGFVRSGFAKNNGGGTAALISFLALLFGRSVRRGAETPRFVAMDPSVASVTGQYFSDRKVGRGSPQSLDMEMARRLFDTCRERTGAPEVPEPPPGAPRVPPTASAGSVAAPG